MRLLKCHIREIQAYLENFLTHQEIRFQQLGISTFSRLQAGTSLLLGTAKRCLLPSEAHGHGPVTVCHLLCPAVTLLGSCRWGWPCSPEET